MKKHRITLYLSYGDHKNWVVNSHIYQSTSGVLEFVDENGKKFIISGTYVIEELNDAEPKKRVEKVI